MLRQLLRQINVILGVNRTFQALSNGIFVFFITFLLLTIWVRKKITMPRIFEKPWWKCESIFIIYRCCPRDVRPSFFNILFHILEKLGFRCKSGLKISKKIYPFFKSKLSFANLCHSILFSIECLNILYHLFKRGA